MSKIDALLDAISMTLSVTLKGEREMEEALRDLYPSLDTFYPSLEDPYPIHEYE